MDDLSKRYPCANPACGNTIERRSRGRQKLFCQPLCQKQAYRGRTHTTIAPEDFNAPYGLYSENSAFPDKQNQSVSEGQKRGVHRIYRGGILGPKSVIQTEVIDAREWQEIISKGGQELKRICRASANRMRSAK